ncbi:Pleiotropic regulator 1 [Hypsibius exemplaris]|uniref:Pleiotropic regulator 1 n=1 Tax=Hypsibius exemplaris TaxID=2072580 RepID=A0A1W0X7R7_HYPEX|nr:Pleiotropic regulator 1 [Hypsibius exemplaris]
MAAIEEVEGTAPAVETPEQSTPQVDLAFFRSTIYRNRKRTLDCFQAEHFLPPAALSLCEEAWKNIKARDQLGAIREFVDEQKKRSLARGEVVAAEEFDEGLSGPTTGASRTSDGLSSNSRQAGHADTGSTSIIPYPNSSVAGSTSQALVLADGQQLARNVLRAPLMPKPKWHPPWKLSRVISGHYGWVRCLTVEPENQWFATGGSDRLIKIWDLASGELKLTLTGHISAVRGLEVSTRHPYLFSASEDKTVKCWDLEYNKVTRHYHGHLSAVYALALHPTIDIFVTCGRDSVARVWDIRTKAGIHVLGGHTNTVADVKCQAGEPQVITASHDSTVRLWDLRMGRTHVTLTHHKKSVRALAMHPDLYMFASGSADNIKEWMCPDGKFVQNLSGHNAIVNALACNSDGVLVSAADNGSMNFWDWRTGYNFQKHKTIAQPGSIESETGVFVTGFDHSGSRLLTGEADKTIKMYKEDESATEETHPIVWRPDILRAAKF